MRVYLEVREQVDIEPEFHRIDVTDKSEAERTQILNALKAFMEEKTYVATKHYCYHDGGGSCHAEEV